MYDVEMFDYEGWRVRRRSLLPLNTICHHVRSPLLSGDRFGVWHAHSLQETQGGVCAHRVVLLIT